ncbi:NAC domain-containing protein 101-like isoform X2 [Rhodamnia argentea]|uniref:NAC domain-containing protein 101-like isoform X2 n=1 Tax=Rhodamnia argentea TaxID=178133 RepID=A0ABM3H3T8_9MYRT|nr:NAC domain-containing protein 101-like isoform X2 [Rhodamnia argentea]
MCPPVVAPSLADMNECRTYEELFVFMFCMAEGYFVPANVITDVNPFNCLPETLLENIWYFMNSMENKGVEGGLWDPSGEPREVFGDASINGWQETYQFYEGQGSDVKKTDWLMLEYYMTPKASSEAASAKDAKSLCKVFRGSSSPLSGSEMLQNQMQVDTTSLDIMRRTSSFILPSHPVENLPELDEFDPRDYIELLDLGIPQSPSSSSDNSSCMTMLSDECFDFLDALVDLEAESGDHEERKDAGCDLVAQAAISGLPLEERPSENTRDGKAVNKDSSPPLTLDSRSSELSNISLAPSADGRNKTDGRLKKLKRKYLPASSSQSSDGSNSSRAPSPGPGGRAKTNGTLKKLQKKCLCFMPF